MSTKMSKMSKLLNHKKRIRKNDDSKPKKRKEKMMIQNQKKEQEKMMIQNINNSLMKNTNLHLSLYWSNAQTYLKKLGIFLF